MDINIPEEAISIANNGGIIALLIEAMPDVNNAIEAYNTTRIDSFTKALDNRIDKDEKKKFIKSAFDEIRDDLENDSLSKAYEYFTPDSPNSANKAMAFFTQLKSLTPFIPKDIRKYLAVITPKINTAFNSDTPLSHDTFLKDILNPVPDIEKYSPLLKGIISEENASEKFLASLIIIHYNKQYLNYLKAQYNELENEPIALPEKINSTMEKLEWLGTQKELGELFVELLRKGWIKEIDSATIKQCFTNTNTIEQVLKPSQDSKTKENSYEGIFTPKYKPSFSEIKPKKTNSL